MSGGTNAAEAGARDTDARSRRAPRRRTRLFVTVAAALTGLLACEVLVRVLQLAPLPRPRNEGSVMQPHPDPVMRYENKPGGVLTRTYIDSPGATPRIVTARVNAQGFRGAEVERARPMGVP